MVILFWGIACFGFSLGSFEIRFEGFDWSARWNLNSAHSRVFNFCENLREATVDEAGRLKKKSSKVG